MTKKLGVLLVDVPELRHAKYCYLEYSQGNYTIFLASKKETVISEAMRCTQEEAKKYPHFRWVALEDLE
ncbi:TPA: hypothetical protein U2B98_001180 [Streptococcus suis]|nr:hypothetical protein [Streptococcus suis]HEM6320276.1 hypothetical protein [Streptococcus suis]